MKFGSEQVICHSTLGHETTAKAFEYKDNTLDSDMKSGNLIVKENQKRLSCDIKDTERDAVCLPYAINDGNGWTAIDFDPSMGMCGVGNEKEDEVRDLVPSPTYSLRKKGSFDEVSDFVMDKGVKECEDLTVCYKESTCHVVKDIWIDEGVPSPEKILFERALDEKTVRINLPPEKDQTEESVKGKEDIKIPILDGLQASAEDDSKEDPANQCDLKDLMHTMKETTSSNVDGVPRDMPLPDDKFQMLETGTYASHLKSEKNDSNKVEQQDIQVSTEKVISETDALVCAKEESNDNSGDSTSAASTLVYTAKESNNGAENPMLATPGLVSSAKESKNGDVDEMLASPSYDAANGESGNGSPVNELAYNSKVEKGSITFDFDSSARPDSSTEECLEKGNSEILATQSTSKLEEGISDAPTVSRQLQRGQGETSFSLAGPGEENFSTVGPSPSFIGYSGPIAYSGSLSLRSDSSTTSTRSFAFPVLQSEWNSSPVRMAKAERRRLQKRRSWGYTFLCCKF